MSFSLFMANSILAGGGAKANITGEIDSWGRSIRKDGGCWLGEFTISGRDIRDLLIIFYERLGGHIEEWSEGVKTWDGIIYEMELTHQVGGLSMTRRRSLDLMHNHIRSAYLDASGVNQITSAASNSQSISRYGRREEILSADRYALAVAEKLRDTALKENAWPWARTTGSGGGETQLRVVVAGYAFTANWRHATSADGSSGNVNTWISSLVTTDCEYLRAGAIATNTYSVERKLYEQKRVYDLITELTNLGDVSHNQWRFYVSPGRRANYQMVGTTPSYYLRNGQVFSSAAGAIEINPWTVQPGVVRDLSYPVRRQEYGAWLDEGRDFYVNEVEVSTENGLVLKTSDFQAIELMMAQEAFQAQGQEALMSTNTGTTGSTKQGMRMHIWQLLGISRKEFLRRGGKAWWSTSEEKRAAIRRKLTSGKYKTKKKNP